MITIDESRVDKLHLPTRIDGHSLRPLPTLRMSFGSGLGSTTAGKFAQHLRALAVYGFALHMDAKGVQSTQYCAASSRLEASTTVMQDFKIR